MTGHVITARCTAEPEPLVATAGQDEGRPVPLHAVYEMVTADWVRQTRAYVRSLHLFQNVARQCARRLDGATRPAERGPSARIAEIRVEADASLVQLTEVQAPAAARCPLTRRQLEIAGLIARGKSNEEIGRELVLTPGTVGNHIGHILRRLGARNRAQIAAWVTQVDARTAPGDERAS